jgi:predicted secreted protein
MKHRLSQGDDGKVLSARIGDEVEVSLHEKPSGGYRWLPTMSSRRSRT